ncbi:MAG: 4-hydroxythreonine-4-phosphate dehydrogenase PdxA [Candidatus Zixiibacteriota bacterium]|nr:MAG: 4-hydroxythreonine-4-phosphate dehydrogenase PdxA [candidate division Zixibacteria bacterium]
MVHPAGSGATPGPRKTGRGLLLPLIISCGDPNGVGPEVTLKALALLPERQRRNVVLAAPYAALTELNVSLGEPLALNRVESLRDLAPDAGIPVLELEGARECRPSYGRISAEAGMVAGRGILWGVSACLNGEASALVTAPVSKEALHMAGYKYPGQTEMIATLAGVTRFIMILTAGGLRVGMATTHVALRQVSGLLTSDLVLDKILALHEALNTWFHIPNPRLAVTALNPHASDGGIFGAEEAQVIIPAVEQARYERLQVEGPLPADTLFPRWRGFDGILAMYHDQGMIPIKMAAFGRAVNFTSGLPFPRTSPDHGTAFDIAGKLMADPKSMVRAIRLAFELAQHRKNPIHKKR